MAGIEENKNAVRELYGRLHGRGDAAAGRELLTDDYVDHDIPGLGEGGREELIGAVLAVRASLPDIAPVLEPVLAEGDLVSIRVVARGHHTGEPFPPGIPASGAAIAWKEAHIFRLRDGKIAEHWGVFDMLGILQQLGAVP